PYLEFVHPEDRESTLNIAKTLLDSMPVINFINRYRCKDGTYRWLSWSTSPHSESELVYCVVRDVTEQKEIAEALQKAHDKLENKVKERTAELRRSNEELRSEITERKQAVEEVRANRDELDTLYTFSTKMRTAKITEDLFAYIIRETCRLLHADDGLVTLLSADKTRYTIANSTEYLAENIGLSFPVEQGLSELLLKANKPVTSENYSADPRALPLKNMDKLGPTALVPLQSEEALVGVLAIARRRESNNRPFTSAEVKTLAALGEIAGNALRRQSLFESAQNRLEQLQRLRNIDIAIAGSPDLNLTFNVILTEVTNLLNLNAAAILRLDKNTATLRSEAGRGFYGEKLPSLTLQLGEGYAGQVVKERQPLHIHDLSKADLDSLQGPLLKSENFTTYYAMPLIAKGRILGVLEVYHRTAQEPDEEWFEYLQALAGQTAIAIDSAELFQNMESANLDLVHVRRGALLHDIGKMGIPDAILLKPGPLTEDEWVVMRKHPVYAYEMLAPIDYLHPALDIPYCHHEKFDGTGYPRGLKGKVIPLAARIFAVTDVYDALTSDRPYRKAWSKEKTLSHIREGSGKHFDPAVVEVFLEEIG
ncbi:MAG: GAF domain-containing protein, partial [Dethiobacteria bacterium]|nr:GAF domain-containing protein [Dethiobacteria bacterium]